MSERDIHASLMKLRVDISSQTATILKNLDALKATLNDVEKDMRLQMGQHWLDGVEKSAQAMLFLELDSEGVDGGEALDRFESTIVCFLEQDDSGRAVKDG